MADVARSNSIDPLPLVPGPAGQRTIACFGLSLLILLCLTSTGWTAQRDKLLRLMPDDVGFCLIVEDLSTHWKKVQDSHWFQKLTNSPPGQALMELDKFQEAQVASNMLQVIFGITWPQLRDDILGDCVVFGYQPKNEMTGKEEQGILLLWAKQEKTLTKLINHINQVQQQSGELVELQKQQYKGHTYFIRQLKKEEKPQIYFQQNNLLVLAGDEALLQQVLDRLGTNTPNPPPTRLVRSFEKAPADGPLATLWIDARTFDPVFEQESNKKANPDAEWIKAFLPQWRAIDTISLSLTPTPQPTVQLTLQGQSDQLAAPLKKLVQEASVHSELWQRVPANSILSMAVRIDFVALVKSLEVFQPKEMRGQMREALQSTIGTALGKDLYTDVLPHLGPDFGFCITPVPGGKGVPDAWLALRIQPGPEDEPVDHAILEGIRVFTVLAAISHNRANKDHIRIEGTQLGSLNIKYVHHPRLPEDIRPAMALKDGYLVLANSPAAIQRFQMQPRPVQDASILRFSLTALAAFFESNEERLTQTITQSSPLSAKETTTWISGVRQLSEIFSGISLEQQTQPGRVQWSLRLGIAQK